MIRKDRRIEREKEKKLMRQKEVGRGKCKEKEEKMKGRKEEGEKRQIEGERRERVRERNKCLYLSSECSIFRSSLPLNLQ